MNTLNYSFRYLANRRGNTLARFVSISLGLLVALLIFSYVGFNHRMTVVSPTGIESTPLGNIRQSWATKTRFQSHWQRLWLPRYRRLRL